jgi:Sulfotransferase domain
MRPHRIILRGLKRLAVFGSKRRVDFLIAGTQKGGTTALDTYLRTHLKIGMADEKEVHFFDEEKYFRHDNPPYSVYHSHFFHVRSRVILGDATPIYMYWREAPKRIQEYNPRMKFILILRNPIERAYSHWNMERDRKAEGLSFWDAIQSEKERCREALPLQHRVYSYIDRGFYAEQLERVWNYFPKEQTLILKSDDLRKNPQPTVNEVCRFLGINPFERVENKEIHSRQYPSPMSAREREFLKRIFAPEIKKLEQLLNWDCSEWLAD